MLGLKLIHDISKWATEPRNKLCILCYYEANTANDVFPQDWDPKSSMNEHQINSMCP